MKTILKNPGAPRWPALKSSGGTGMTGCAMGSGKVTIGLGGG